MAAPGLNGSTQDLCCGMWDIYLQHVGSSSSTRGWTRAPCIGRVESQPQDRQGSPSGNPLRSLSGSFSLASGSLCNEECWHLLFVGDFSSVKSSKILCIPWGRTRTPLEACTIASWLLPPCLCVASLHWLPAVWILAIGTQGTSGRLKSIPSKQEMGDTERLLCPGTPQGPPRFQCPFRTFSLGLCIHPPGACALEAKTSQSRPPELSLDDGKHLTWGGGSGFSSSGQPTSTTGWWVCRAHALAWRWCDVLFPDIKYTVFSNTNSATYRQFTNNWLSSNSFNNDANSPELHSRLKGSVLQDCPYFRGQLQWGVQATHTSAWPPTNRRDVMVPSGWSP